MSPMGSPPKLVQPLVRIALGIGVLAARQSLSIP